MDGMEYEQARADWPEKSWDRSELGEMLMPWLDTISTPK